MQFLKPEERKRRRLAYWLLSGVGRAVGQPPLLLDTLSVPSAVATALRRLRGDYVGQAIRVRRSSDNAEADIGFATSVQTRTNLAAVPANNAGGQTVPGVTMTNLGSGVEFGQSYQDVEWGGTPTSGAIVQFFHSGFGPINADIHAVVQAGQTYTTSIGYRLLAGAMPGTPPAIRTVYRTAAGGLISTPQLVVPLATAALQRVAITTVAPATAAYAQPNLIIPIVVGVPFTMRIRFYAPNVEVGGGNARPLLLRNEPEVVAEIGDLDAEAALAFCGSGDGFVPTWYEQSGNARDAVQTVAASQPIIVTAGALNTVNGRPALRFDGINHFMDVAAPIALGGVAVVLNALDGAVFDDFNGILCGQATSGLIARSGLSSVWAMNTVGTPRINGVSTGNFAPLEELKILVSNNTVTVAEPVGWRLGQDRANTARRWNGNMGAVIAFPPLLSAGDLAILESGLGARYGITVA